MTNHPGRPMPSPRPRLARGPGLALPAALLALGLLPASRAAQAQSLPVPPPFAFETIYQTGSATDGRVPHQPLVRAADGTLYGVTQFGGPADGGTVFRIAADGSRSTLRSFRANGEGLNPNALLLGPGGRLYGTTAAGDGSLAGTIYSMAADGSGFTVLHRFQAAGDGATPVGSLLPGNDGRLYGVTRAGGSRQLGSLFRIEADGSGYTLLKSFGGRQPGQSPGTGLIADGRGGLIGAASDDSGNALVYRYAPATRFYSVVHRFSAEEGVQVNALLAGADGNVYGSAFGGGAAGYGAVFRLDARGRYLRMRSFGIDSDLISPTGLMQARDGRLYGTARSGLGPFGEGGVFSVGLDSGYRRIFSFGNDGGAGDDGATPTGGLVEGEDGVLYGTASRSAQAAGGRGTMFTVTTGGRYTRLAALGLGTSEGAARGSALLRASDGNFYGTTPYGGRPDCLCGTVYRIGADGRLTTIWAFQRHLPNQPASTLVQGADGQLYGITTGGAVPGGAVFRLRRDGSGYVNLHSFATASEGYGSITGSSLLRGSDGNFYGVNPGGPDGGGVIYKLTPAGALTVLRSFPSSDGDQPGSLVQASDGNLYGTTERGGSKGIGSVFRLGTAGQYALLYSFAGGSDGARPQQGLVQGADGFLYGTTPAAGDYATGTAFRISMAGAYLRLASLPAGTTMPRGPQAALTQGADGNFYGVAQNSVAAVGGSVFRLTPQGLYTTVRAFGGGDSPGGDDDGEHPLARLVTGADGRLYGSTTTAARNGLGTLFRFTPQP